MEDNKTEEFKALVKDELSKQYNRGVEVGTKTVCRYVLNLLGNSSVPLIQRVNAVKKFCNTPLKNERGNS